MSVPKFKVTDNMVNAALEEAVIFADHYPDGYGSEEESKVAFIKAVIQAAADQWLEDNK